MDATNQPRFILIPRKNFLKEKESYLDLEIEISGEQNLKRDYCLFWEKGAGEVSLFWSDFHSRQFFF